MDNGCLLGCFNCCFFNCLNSMTLSIFEFILSSIGIGFNSAILSLTKKAVSIPSVISSFINIEDMNSSIKLIRPTQHIIPYNLKGFEKTLNLFGFNIEPFSINNTNATIEQKSVIFPFGIVQ